MRDLMELEADVVVTELRLYACRGAAPGQLVRRGETAQWPNGGFDPYFLRLRLGGNIIAKTLHDQSALFMYLASDGPSLASVNCHIDSFGLFFVRRRCEVV